MIKDNQKFLNRLHLVLDILIVILSYMLAWYLKFKSIFFEGIESKLGFADYMLALIWIVPLFLLMYSACSLYSPKRVMGRRVEISKIVQANSLGVMLILTILFITRQEHFSRQMTFIFYIINIILGVAVRLGIHTLLRAMRKQGFNQKHILLIGYSQTAKGYIDRIRANPQWGYTIVGILDDNIVSGKEYRGVKILGRIANLEVILPENRLDEIAITLGLSEYNKLEHIVAECEKSGVHTKFIPDYMKIIPTKPYTEDLMGLPVINIRYVPLSNTFNSFVKRCVDIFGALVGIVLFSPIMLIVAVLIKATSKGPLIYKQDRVGLHNKPFKMYKFRSMVVQKETEEKKCWTTKGDARVTSVGKFIRKTSIDELPQFFNILKGDMSVVGPRPERPQYVEKFREEIPRYMVKHQVRPGLTGWAQINGYRGDTPIKRRVEYDIFYIENWTLSFDIKIMLLTIFKGFINKNAY